MRCSSTSPTALSVVWAIAFVAVIASCVTTPEATIPAVAVAPELDVGRVCDMIVDVGDAAARGGLAARRQHHEITASGDRHAAFAAMLALPTPEERFRAFHADGERFSTSGVGPLGECLVYASWAKMGGETARACDVAALKVGASAVLVEVARAESDLVQQRAPAAALARVDAALALAPTCAALHVVRARARATDADVRTARDAWAAAATAAPRCFRCLIEQAALEERLDTGPGGRAAAASVWEQALKLAPDHADTLRRFAAATAGIDDARALRAWEAAIAAGARDPPTLLAAAQLASKTASTPTELDAALGYARRAVDAAKQDPEPRRLVVDLAVRRGAVDEARSAAQGVLDLLPDDVVAHAALARIAVTAGPLVDGVVHYDAAVAALDRGAVVEPATATTIRAEQAGLLVRLQVNDARRPAGNVNAVANATQRALQTLWRDRIAKKATKGGTLTIVVESAADGHVVSTQLRTDTVGDQEIAAAAVAWLSRATISGGARRHTLDFILQ
jgi:hypothetical protein